jgi:hypothetical protein
MPILSGEMVQNKKNRFLMLFLLPFCGHLANMSDMGHRRPVLISGLVLFPNRTSMQIPVQPTVG